MELNTLQKRAREIKLAYDAKNIKEWTAAEYLQGLVGDVGDLTKLVMAKDGFRDDSELDQKLAHELSDCLWSIFVLADELNIDLEKAYLKTMDELKTKLK